MTWSATVLTLFPEMFPGPLGHSLAGRAFDAGVWRLKTVDIRAFARDKHASVDDTPFGGGAGMVMRADVVSDAIHAAWDRRGPLIHLSPRGRPLTQRRAAALAGGPGPTLLWRALRGDRPAPPRRLGAGGGESRGLRAVRRRAGGARPAGRLRAAAAGRGGQGRSRSGRRVSRAGCWNTRITRARRSGPGARRRKSCFRAITATSAPGGRRGRKT